MKEKIVSKKSEPTEMIYIPEIKEKCKECNGTGNILVQINDNDDGFVECPCNYCSGGE